MAFWLFATHCFALFILAKVKGFVNITLSEEELYDFCAVSRNDHNEYVNLKYLHVLMDEMGKEGQVLGEVGIVFDRIGVNFQADEQYTKVMSEMFTFTIARFERHNWRRSVPISIVGY